jgi:predicted HTH transcriptional regulator
VALKLYWREDKEIIMLTQEELEKLIADLESARVERTISTDNTDKFSQAVCAFANVIKIIDSQDICLLA